MYTNKMQSLRWLLVALVLLLTFAFALPAQAITNRQVHEQKLLVMGRLVDTLREQVKLLQMILIQKLERRVETLETELATR